MLCTLGGGYFQMYYPMKMFEKTPERKKLPQNFHRNMMIVGSLRYNSFIKEKIFYQSYQLQQEFFIVS